MTGSKPAFPAEITEGFHRLSAAQQDMLSNASPEQRPLMEAQMKMQKEMELNQLLAQLLKSDHEEANSIVKNIGV